MTRRARTRLLVLLGVVAALLVWKIFFTFSLVVGESMSPTLRHWDFCLMRRIHAYQPHRGDIVSFRTTDNPPLYFIKRIIALPGETIAITNGVVLINGAPLAEPYTTANSTWNMAPANVPVDKVYVIGDHRDVAQNETLHGLVATRLIQTRLLRHWRWKK